MLFREGESFPLFEVELSVVFYLVRAAHELLQTEYITNNDQRKAMLSFLTRFVFRLQH